MAVDFEAAGLTLSGPIVVTTPGTVIENLYIRATGDTPGIIVSGADDVVIRNVLIEHETASGISIDDSNGVVIDTVEVSNTVAPAAGPHDGSYVNIDVFRSADVSLTNVRVEQGSSGVLAIDAEGLTIDGFEAVDQRGPFPRGQGVQLDSSNGAVIENFRITNNPATAWTEDNISVIDSTEVVIRNGVIDGNNAPSGVGVLIESYDAVPGAGVTVENVQVYAFYNGAFSAANSATDVAFRDVYAEAGLTPQEMSEAAGDNYRGPPLSGQEAFHSFLAADSILFEGAAYFDIPAAPAFFSDPGLVTTDGFTEARQEPDATSFVTSMPWDAAAGDAAPGDADPADDGPSEALGGSVIIIDAAADLYEGAPVMRVAHNGQVLFEGVVTADSDAGALDRITITTDAPLDLGVDLEFSFLNDAYGGDGLDRNLLIERVEIDGRAVLLDQTPLPAGADYDDALVFYSEATLVIDADNDAVFENALNDDTLLESFEDAAAALAVALALAEDSLLFETGPGPTSSDGFDLL